MFHYVNQENGQYAPLLLKVHKVIMDNAEFWLILYTIEISTTIILVLKH
jgi:hypothetical protein